MDTSRFIRLAPTLRSGLLRLRPRGRRHDGLDPRLPGQARRVGGLLHRRQAARDHRVPGSSATACSSCSGSWAAWLRPPARPRAGRPRLAARLRRRARGSNAVPRRQRCHVHGRAAGRRRPRHLDDVATVYGDLFSALGFIAAPFALAVLVAVLAVVNSRTPFLPTWLTWVSVVLASCCSCRSSRAGGHRVLGCGARVVSILLFFRDNPIDTA